MTHAPLGDRRLRADDGFTLIEVVVALVLLGIVATGALFVFIQGNRTSSHLQRGQNAVAVANEAMERAYAVNPRNHLTTTVPGPVVGRAQADVTAAWSAAAALGAPGPDQTYPLWDPAVTTSSTAVLPITTQPTHSGQRYTVRTLVGSCFRSASVTSPDQPCGKISGVTDDPGDAGTPAGMVRMLRVTVLVTWTATVSTCPGGTCQYQITGLVDRSADVKWNRIVRPVAVDDFATYTFGETRDISVLVNDVLGPVTSNPVTIVAPPSTGEGTASVGSTGVVTYKAPTDASGVFFFTYRIKDASGAQSAAARIQITLPPLASADTFRVPSGSGTALDLLANDQGKATAVAVTVKTPPTKGTVTVNGLDVVYTPTVSSGDDTFTYTYTNASGQESPETTATVRVDQIVVQDRFVELPMRTTTTDAWSDLTALLLSGNSSTTGWTINVSGPAPASGVGTLAVGGATYAGTAATGTTVRFNPAQGWAGEYSFGYSLTNSSGTTSATRTVLVRVVAPPPSAVADGFGYVGTANTVVTLPILTNDTPTTVSATGPYRISLGALPTDGSCGTFSHTSSELAAGIVKIKTGADTGTPRSCTFSYSLVGTGNGAPTTAVSGPAPVDLSWGPA